MLSHRNLVIVPMMLLCVAWSPSARSASVCTPEQEALHQPAASDSAQADVYRKRREAMAPLDGNCDGVVNSTEWATAIAGMFQVADLDRDGKLSRDEQQKMTAAYTAKTEKIIGATKIVETREIQTSLYLMDKDGDGLITTREFEDYYSGVFRGMDKNSDNVIDIDEFHEGFEGVRRVQN